MLHRNGFKLLQPRSDDIKHTEEDENLPLKVFVRSATCGTSYTELLFK